MEGELLSTNKRSSEGCLRTEEYGGGTTDYQQERIGRALNNVGSKHTVANTYKLLHLLILVQQLIKLIIKLMRINKILIPNTEVQNLINWCINLTRFINYEFPFLFNCTIVVYS